MLDLLLHQILPALCFPAVEHHPHPLVLCELEKSSLLIHTQFVSAFRAIGDGIMAVVNGIAGILTGLVSAVVELCRVIVRCLTCGKVR